MERLVHILVVSLTLVACSQSADSRWPWVRARYGLQRSIELDRAYVDVAVAGYALAMGQAEDDYYECLDNCN